MELLFAATYPDRVERLVVYGSYARLVSTPGFDAGMPEQAYQRFCDRLIAEWGGPVLLREFAPTLAEDPRARAWWGRLLRSGASPRSAGALLDLYRQIDVRDILPAIGVPTLVLQRRGDRMVRPRQGRYLAEHIPGARYVELEGSDHVAFAGDTDAILDEIEAFATGTRPRRTPDRILATVLFEDIVESTRRAADVGDSSWRGLLDAHGAVVEEAVHRYGGRVVKTLGDGTLAIFDGPARAIRSAVAIRAGVRELGLDVRAGLHTGELEQMNGDVGGIAVHIGARVAAASDPGEVLVSRTVTDLVAGSGLVFSDRGDHELKGVPGSWRLYAVEGS
jgi:class 3 adenylate cyclase